MSSLRCRAAAAFPLNLAAVLLLVMSGAAPAALASPVTPTFVLKWGTSGSGPGRFISISSMAADSLGNVYVVDSATSRIQKFDVLGNYLSGFGTFGFGPGEFNIAYGIAGDGAGNLYVSEFSGNRVKKVTSTGAVVLQWGTTGTGDGQFREPQGIAVDAAGHVYVADANNHRIQKFDAAGNYVAQWGAQGDGDGQFYYPTALAVDGDGFVYVSDTFNHRIQKFTSTGAFAGMWGIFGSAPGQLNTPGPLAFDAVGNLYVTDSGNNRIQKFTPDGTYVTHWGTTGAGQGQLDSPAALAVDAEANVYVGEFSNHRIQKFSGAGVPVSRTPPVHHHNLLQGPETGGRFHSPGPVAAGVGGNIYLIAGEDVMRVPPVGPAVVWGSQGSGNGQFFLPSAIATDAAGNVFVLDGGNSRVQKFTATGTYLTKWGSLGSGNGQFNQPQGIAVDAAGNVFVCDRANNRIQKFSSAGVFLGKWGTNGTGNGQFAFARGVGVDRHGNVYVVDVNNRNLQKFTGDGQHLVTWGTVGSGPGQWFSPVDVDIDARGNVYVVDYADNVQVWTSSGTYLSTIDLPPATLPTGVAVDSVGNLYLTNYDGGPLGDLAKYVTSPAIIFAGDVPNDQGGQVKLRILPSMAEAPGSGATILGYDAFLSGAAPSPTTIEGAGRLPGVAGYLIPATGAAEYTVEVPTLADATAAALQHSGYFVRAWSGPSTYFASGLEYGMSIDNLPPPSPLMTAVYEAGSTHLHWNASPAADFATFRLHRGTDPSFAPGPATLLVSSPDTGYVDPGPAGRWYKLFAVDQSGNESPISSVGPEQTVDVELTALRFDLESVRPNPASLRHGHGLIVRFSLPSDAPASLELVDVAGRRVARHAVGALGAGTHAVNLLAGSARLGSGVYMLRLTQGDAKRVRRVVVMD